MSSSVAGPPGEAPVRPPQAPVRAPQEAAAQNRDAAEITVKANGEVKEGKETERRPSPSVIGER